MTTSSLADATVADDPACTLEPLGFPLDDLPTAESSPSYSTCTVARLFFFRRSDSLVAVVADEAEYFALDLLLRGGGVAVAASSSCRRLASPRRSPSAMIWSSDAAGRTEGAD